MTAPSRPWTCAEQQRLRFMAAAGMSNGEIAAVLGRSRTAVCYRRWEMRVGYPNGNLRGICVDRTPRQGRIVEILRSASEPMSVHDLVTAVHGEASPGAVQTMRVLIYNLRRRGVRIVTEGRRYSLQTAPKPVLIWSDRRDETVLDMRDEGASTAEIAVRLGLPVDAVARRLCVLQVRRRAA